MGALVGVSDKAVSKWENGTSFPDIEKLCMLSEIFNVSIDALIGHSNEDKKLMIAIDGGGTKTVVAVSDENGKILMKKTGKSIKRLRKYKFFCQNSI